jgi:hypothetical protein
MTALRRNASTASLQRENNEESGLITNGELHADMALGSPGHITIWRATNVGYFPLPPFAGLN